MKRASGAGGPDSLFVQLHNLQMVAAVAASGSISGGGRDLYRSPSVVTRGVAEVEEVLGIELFDRSSSGFRSNWYGQLLIERIRRIEEEIAAAMAELARVRGGEALSPANLRHLMYSGRKLLLLIHLSESRTASGAAATLRITPSGVSMALGRLEEGIGLRLFHRNLQGMAPTDAGERLVLRARRMRAELRHALSELASAGGEPTGAVVVGALPLARTAVLPRAIAACLDRAPSVRIEAIEAPAENLLRRLRSGEVDLVLTVPGEGFEPRGVIADPLFSDHSVVIAAAGHPLAGRRLDPAEIIDQRWILPGRHSASRALFDRQLAAQGLSLPPPAVQTADLALIRRLLRERGDMLALTSRELVQDELASGTVAALDLNLPPIAREVVMLRREGAMLSPAVQAMIAAAREQVAVA
ncbi:LysR family transcriptional regulator [Novosphingobium flavum]|uniref:LysR family transcriptional regulator n=1 Tax=Novosphingobium flavum TaxID=1778672 RepID=A0A7X1FSA6_9SPHN|nr:LysR family transcriptional regulator [Novosphingobium flavum]MBC2666066.1 LysR family transcriptional regulator [Novosphingobium flavum]